MVKKEEPKGKSAKEEKAKEEKNEQKKEPESQKKQIQMNGQQLAQNFELSRQRLEALNERLNSMMRIKREIEITINALEEIKKQQEIKVLIGSGVFVEAKIIDSKNVLVTLPENIMVSQDAEKTQNELKKRVEETRKTLEQIGKQRQQALGQAQFFQNLMVKGQQIIRQQQQKKQAQGKSEF